MNDDSDRLTPLSADLHIHSALSPCAENAMTPENIVKKLMQYDIDVFSITDHNAGYNARAFEIAGKEKNILFIPGIELQSSEEIHLMGYFPDIGTLDAFCTTVVKPNLLQGQKNDPSSFGNQIRIDEHGKSIGEVPDMLSMPLSLSLNELVARVHAYGGVPVPAHLDRGMSVLSQLGFIPADLSVKTAEIWGAGKIRAIREKHLDDRGINVISSSDTHHLHMMKPAKMKLWVKVNTVQGCLDCLRGEGRISVKEGRRSSRDSALQDKGWKSLYSKK